MRPALLRLHRWAGLTVGVLVAVVVVSGALAVPQADLERWVGLREVPGSGRGPFAAAMTAVAQAFPAGACDKVFPADGPGRPDAYEVTETGTGGKRTFTVFCDPPSGRVIGDTRDSRLIAAVRAVAGFHHRLMLPGTPREVLLVVSAIALLAFAASGLVLWCTGSRPAVRGATALAVHRLVGVLSMPVLVLSAVTGLLFAWHGTRTLAYRLLGGDPANPPYFVMTDPDRLELHGNRGARPLDLDGLVAAARAQPAAQGTARVLRVTSMADKPAKPVKVVLDYPGNGDGRSGGVVFHLDRTTGEPALVDDPRRSLATTVLAHQWSLHTGRWGGSAGIGGLARGVWILAGLGGGVLLLSGALLWWRRRGMPPQNRASPTSV